MPDVTFGAVSLHLKSLAAAGLARTRAAHRHRFYRADPRTLGPVKALLERMWDDALWTLMLEAELQATRRGPRPRKPRKRHRR